MRLTQPRLLFLLHKANEWLRTALQNANKPLPHKDFCPFVIQVGLSVATHCLFHWYCLYYAQGTKDFISKFEIALKECNESEYWLELLYETNGISKTEFDEFQKKCIEIRRMLASSVTTLKNK